jgi:hypothetical protein
VRARQKATGAFPKACFASFTGSFAGPHWPGWIDQHPGCPLRCRLAGAATLRCAAAQNDVTGRVV